MKKDNVIQQKSFTFAIRIVNIYRFLVDEKREFVLSKQLVRSGTSIGANVEEALGGVSDKDFLYKLGIAYKEARETIYWLRLFHATDYLTESQAASLIADAEELCRILGKIQTTLKNKPPK
jgi:four helix bundle protein